MNTHPSHSPNVIVFLTDQQRWDTMGLHGNPLDLTPNLDRMAHSGTHVANSFTCQPVCAPARASFQTGQYALRTGVYRNGFALKPEARTLAHYFRDAGYRTGYIGKWHLADDDPVVESQRGGYEDWLSANLLEFVSEPYSTTLFDNNNQSVDLPGYRVDALTDAAIRYVDQQRGNSFFLFLSFLEPHHQNHVDDYVAPDGYRERYAGRWTPPDLLALGGTSPQHLGGYYGMVKRLDEALGRILDALKSLSLFENTIVLFTSDHGCHFKTRNGEYKRSCHDSSIRVPTVFHGPGFTGGGQVRQLVSLVDLPATLLDAAGIPVPDTMDGQSILPLLRGQIADWPEEVYIQISESQVGRAIRTHRWKYAVSAPETLICTLAGKRVTSLEQTSLLPFADASAQNRTSILRWEPGRWRKPPPGWNIAMAKPIRLTRTCAANMETRNRLMSGTGSLATRCTAPGKLATARRKPTRSRLGNGRKRSVE